MAGAELMRIVAGSAKGRRLKTPAAGTRPPTGRMREGTFSALGARVRDAEVLDLFAGSGAFGLEALSRGAAGATFVERSPAAVRALRDNVDAVGLGGTIVRSDVARFAASAARAGSGPFDIVFVDPPYAMSDDAVVAILDAVAPLVAADGVVLVHRRAGARALEPEFLRLRRTRRYGDGELSWYERREDTA